MSLTLVDPLLIIWVQVWNTMLLQNHQTSKLILLNSCCFLFKSVEASRCLCPWPVCGRLWHSSSCRKCPGRAHSHIYWVTDFTDKLSSAIAVAPLQMSVARAGTLASGQAGHSHIYMAEFWQIWAINGLCGGTDANEQVAFSNKKGAGPAGGAERKTPVAR